MEELIAELAAQEERLPENLAAVDLPTGAVAVTSDRPLDEAQVRAAVEEAGYELVG